MMPVIKMTKGMLNAIKSAPKGQLPNAIKKMMSPPAKPKWQPNTAGTDKRVTTQKKNNPAVRRGTVSDIYPKSNQVVGHARKRGRAI